MLLTEINDKGEVDIYIGDIYIGDIYIGDIYIGHCRI
jgi:hypothetical protein